MTVYDNPNLREDGFNVGRMGYKNLFLIKSDMRRSQIKSMDLGELKELLSQTL